MSHTTIRNVQQQDVIYELKAFIGGSTQDTKCSHVELAKTALSLLKTLPAARDAVLEYFCVVFNSATQNFIVRLEVSKFQSLNLFRFLLSYCIDGDCYRTITTCI